MSKEAAAFKKRQMAAIGMISSVKQSGKSEAVDRSSHEPKVKRPKPTSSSAKASHGQKKNPHRSYELDRAMGNRFQIITKIVKYLKTRFHEGLLEPLCIEDLLEEARLQDTAAVVKGWLSSDALPNNPKVEIVQKNGARCFKFRPRYPKVRDKASLLNLLQSYAEEGEGGVLLEDLLESAPNAVSLVHQLESSGDAITVPLVNQRRLNAPQPVKQSDGDQASSSQPTTSGRQTNLVVFSSQRQYGLADVDEKLIAMWRAIEPGGAEIASALAGEAPDKNAQRGKGKRGRPPNKKTADGIPSFKQTNSHLANSGLLMNFGQ